MKYSVIRILTFICLFFLSRQSYAQFIGGESDGHANLRLFNATCAAINVNPFIGGQADGHANLRLSNSICIAINVNPFAGGQADGHANLRLSNLICSVISVNPFTGGQADGQASLQLSNVPFLVCLGIATPIELLSFDAECINNIVKIRWATVSETNNDYFTIEHSNDAIIFEKVAVIQGAGNSNNIINYYFDDTKPLTGTSYYRIKQTDYKGNAEYSEIVSANCNNEAIEDIKVYPNPVLDELTIEIKGNNELITFEIINTLGVVVSRGVLSSKITVQMQDFAPGIYLLKFTNILSSKTNAKTFENRKIIKW